MEQGPGGSSAASPLAAAVARVSLRPGTRVDHRSSRASIRPEQRRRQQHAAGEQSDTRTDCRVLPARLRIPSGVRVSSGRPPGGPARRNSTPKPEKHRIRRRAFREGPFWCQETVHASHEQPINWETAAVVLAEVPLAGLVLRGYSVRCPACWRSPKNRGTYASVPAVLITNRRESTISV
jgi:hypothetical protein